MIHIIRDRRNLALSLCLFKSSGSFDVHSRSLGLDLSNRPGEPPASPQKPRAKGPQRNDSDAHWRVVKSLVCYGSERRQAKHDDDEEDPTHSNERHRP